MDTALLSGRFKRFAERECEGSSRLYEFLSMKILGDNDLLEMSSYCSPCQPVPNLLFASVHYLLLSGTDHELKEFYPSVTDKPHPVEESFPSFKDFCQHYRNEIIGLLQSKLVQTNEIRRCTYLYPSFCYIYNKVRKPLSPIEIGTSAGLQLLWDKCSYSYGTHSVYGELDSSVHLTAELRNGNAPVLLHNCPPVASKIGIDLHVVNLSNKENYLWLKSLIWPEHKERLELLEKAAQLFNATPVDLVEGDGVSLLPRISAFFKTSLKEYLDTKEIDTIILAGLQTEYCIDATLKSAFESGYRVIIPEQTNTTFDNEYMSGEVLYKFYNYKIWNNRFAKVLPVDEVSKLLLEN